MFEKIKVKLAKALLSKTMTTTSPELADFFGGVFASYFIAGQPVYTELTLAKALREGYKWSPAVYSAVRSIVKAGSVLPWIVLDKDGERIDNHPFEQLMMRPNPNFSGQDLMEFLIAHLKLVGNGLWQPIIVNGQVKELWTIMPDLVKPIPSDVKGQWLKGWEVADADGTKKTVPPYQDKDQKLSTYIHFMQFDPGNPYWGMGDLYAAARTVDTDNEAQDTQKVSMQNRGMPSGIFSPEEAMTEPQFKEAERVMKERYLDKTKRREPWIVSRKMSWTETSLTPVEMDYIASRLQNLRSIASVFGLDPWWVGDREHSTYNNVQEARKALYIDVIIPLLDDIAATMNLQIAPLYEEGITITYDTSNVEALREDYGKKVDQAVRLFSLGVPVSQANEILELGLVEFPGWDNSYLPFNVMPFSATPPAKMMTKALNLNTEEQKSIHWKRIDRRRMGWWGVVTHKVKPLYQDEADAVLKAIKGVKPDKLADAAASAIDSLETKWKETFMAISTAILEDFGNEIVPDLGGHPAKGGEAPSEVKQWVFNPFSAAARAWVLQHGAESIRTILDTNKADVRAIILGGLDKDLGAAQIAKDIRQFYSDQSAFKAMRVARTETASAAGFGQQEAAKQSGVVKTKQWISSRDDRVRDSHQLLDGEEVDFGERYSNGLMYPGDPSGDPGEFINCRCAEGYGTGG